MIRKIDEKDCPQLAEIWESAVSNTHDFLSAEDFSFYKERLPEYFRFVELYGFEQDGALVGFLGVAGNGVEMLFVHNDFRGCGIGRKLLRFALDSLHADRLDVNEQNAQAVGFYEHMGFVAEGRSDLDSDGKPYPILHMRYRGRNRAIRLIYPQWQGADIARLVPEIGDPDLASRGYFLGAQLLDFLAPQSRPEDTFTVPVSTGAARRKVTGGVLDRDEIIGRTAAALDILDAADPDRIVTLGGECSVSVVPFTWLARKYDGDIAVVWIDAHPDITLPGDVYAGYHAMAVTACMGLGEEGIVSLLPSRIDPSRILHVGLRDWEREEIRKRQREYGIMHLAPEETREDSGSVLRWLDSCGASRVLVHFDMDVLDPAEIVAAAGVVPGGMKVAEVVRVINDIATAKDLVGLTVAEPMPRTAIRLKEMLSKLPLLGGRPCSDKAC